MLNCFKHRKIKFNKNALFFEQKIRAKILVLGSHIILNII